MTTKYKIAFAILIILPIFVTAIVYPFLPETVPTHFGVNNIADDFGNKSSVWLVTILYTFCNLMVLGSAFFVKNDSKTSIAEARYNNRVLFITAIYLDFLSIYLLYVTATYDENNPSNMFALTIGIAVVLVIFGILDYIRIVKGKKIFGI